MKQLFFASLALLGSINAAEPAAHPTRQLFVIGIPRMQVGSSEIILTIPTAAREEIKVKPQTVWRDQKDNVTVVGQWIHQRGHDRTPSNTVKVQECVREMADEGTRYECSPSTGYDETDFNALGENFLSARANEAKVPR
jgi:hypothetical protein